MQRYEKILECTDALERADNSVKMNQGKGLKIYISIKQDLFLDQRISDEPLKDSEVHF